MYKGEPTIPLPAGGVKIPATLRPQGLGRRNPHNAYYTRKNVNKNTDKEAELAGLAISNGLDKISMFFTGKSNMLKKPIINKSNPFKKMMDIILNRKGK